MDHPIVYIEMSKLCRYEKNYANIEIKSDFRAFLATLNDRTWSDDKNRIWKYYVSSGTTNDKNILHPFLANYKPDVYNSLIDIYVYYLVCVYVGAQLDIPEITLHARHVSDFIKGYSTLEDVSRNVDGKFLAILNLFVDHTDIIVCYNNNDKNSNERNGKEIVVSNANVNLYNPKINLIADENNVAGDDDYNDETSSEINTDYHFNENDDDDDDIYSVDGNALDYTLKFVEDLSECDADSTAAVDSFVAVGFVIRSNAKTILSHNFPNSESYLNDRHNVTLFLMISKDVSRSFEEILQVQGARSNTTYICPYSRTLYAKLSAALSKVNCNFVVDNISSQGRYPIVVFNDIKSKPYDGQLLDISIDITYGK